MPEVKLKMRLISHTKNPEQVVAAAIKQCYSRVGADDLRKKLMRRQEKD